jgi:hypothetical protein
MITVLIAIGYAWELQELKSEKNLQEISFPDTLKTHQD